MTVSVDNITQLKNIRVDQANGVIRFVVSKISWYYPDVDSVFSGNDDDVVVPNLGVGRWIKQKATPDPNVVTANFTTSTISANLTADFDHKYIIDESAFVGTTLTITLPDTGLIDGGQFEVFVDDTNASKRLIFAGVGGVLINNNVSDLYSSFIKQARYVAIYINSNAGWIITQETNYVNNNGVLFTRGGSPNFSRFWDGVTPANYAYNLGLVDIMGRDLNVANPYLANTSFDRVRAEFTSGGLEYITGNSGGTLINLSQTSLPTDTFFFLLGDSNSSQKWIQLRPYVNTNQTWYIKPTGFLIIYKTLISTFKTKATLLTYPSFRNFATSIAIDASQYRPFDAVYNKENDVNYNFYTNQENYWTYYSKSRTTVDLHSPSPNPAAPIDPRVVVLDSTQLPSPYNSTQFLGILINIDPLTTDSYFSNFRFRWTSIFPTISAAIQLHVWTTDNLLDTARTYMYPVFVDIFGEVYKATIS